MLRDVKCASRTMDAREAFAVLLQGECSTAPCLPEWKVLHGATRIVTAPGPGLRPPTLPRVDNKAWGSCLSTQWMHAQPNAGKQNPPPEGTPAVHRSGLRGGLLHLQVTQPSRQFVSRPPAAAAAASASQPPSATSRAPPLAATGKSPTPKPPASSTANSAPPLLVTRQPPPQMAVVNKPPATAPAASAGTSASSSSAPGARRPPPPARAQGRPPSARPPVPLRQRPPSPPAPSATRG
jgi:hypothetical protein